MVGAYKLHSHTQKWRSTSVNQSVGQSVANTVFILPIMAELAARLEPYLLLARSAKGAAAAKVVENATSAVSVASHLPTPWHHFVCC